MLASALMAEKTSFTFALTPEQRQLATDLLRNSNYRPAVVQYADVAVTAGDFNATLYKSGKLVIQGKGASDFVLFAVEPYVLQAASMGYEDLLNPERSSPHMGVDESGKGDFFGPLVVVAAYVNETLAEKLRGMDVRDSKNITSDKRCLELGRDIRKLLDRRFAVVKIGPAAYNRLYLKMRSVNTLLAWGHARAIENLLDLVPDCPRAISDQFGKKEQVERALMQKGRSIELVQRHKAESDIAVAAASVVARELFLRSLVDMRDQYKQVIPKGASAEVKIVAGALLKAHGPRILLDVAKCHFKTTDEVLQAHASNRAALGAEGRAVSKPFTGYRRPGSASSAAEGGPAPKRPVKKA